MLINKQNQKKKSLLMTHLSGKTSINVYTILSNPVLAQYSFSLKAKTKANNASSTPLILRSWGTFQMADGRMQISMLEGTISSLAVPVRTVSSHLMLFISQVPAPCTNALFAFILPVCLAFCMEDLLWTHKL